MKRIFFPTSLALTLALFAACDEPTHRPPPKRGGWHPTDPTTPTKPTTDPDAQPDKSDKPDKPTPDETKVNPIPEQPKTVGEVPYGKNVPGKPGFVTSPFSPYSGYIDVRGFPPGTEVKDPYSGKTFLVP